MKSVNLSVLVQVSILSLYTSIMKFSCILWYVYFSLAARPVEGANLIEKWILILG